MSNTYFSGLNAGVWGCDTADVVKNQGKMLKWPNLSPMRRFYGQEQNR